jgi:hypothetical protein
MRRWGFATLVGVAVLVGVIVGATVAVPIEIPAVALRSGAVYRLEVGGAIFVGLYFVAMAFVLALRNRGFTEIGTDGIRAESMEEVPRSLLTQERALKVLFEKVNEMGDLHDGRGGR